MLSEYEKSRKKENFIRKKVDELVDIERNKNLNEQGRLLAIAEFYSKLGSLDIGIYGFNLVNNKQGYYEIRNAAQNGCTYYSNTSGKWMSKCLEITMFDTICRYDFESENSVVVILPFLEQFADLEKEYLQLSADLDKSEKITEMSQKSAEIWLKELFKDTEYSYYTVVGDNKITLSVQLKNGTQIDIPVYYKKFQIIIPEIMATIKEYEQITEKIKIKVLISNIQRKEQWIKNK